MFKIHQIVLMMVLSALLSVVASCANNDQASDLSSGIAAGAQQDKHATEVRNLTIRDVDGTDLITQDDILSYNVETHVLTLVPGKRDKIVPSQSLIGGSPFTIFVDGKSQYSGRFTTSLSSQSVNDVVINLSASELENNQLQISLGYPVRSVYTAAGDPRGNDTVIAALRALGKVGG